MQSSHQFYSNNRKSPLNLILTKQYSNDDLEQHNYHHHHVDVNEGHCPMCSQKVSGSEVKRLESLENDGKVKPSKAVPRLTTTLPWSSNDDNLSSGQRP